MLEQSGDQGMEMTERLRGCEDAICEVKEELASLKDLFVRRLREDKQKAGLIRCLEEMAGYAWIEPFLSDILLLLDRLERSEGELARSAEEELYEIIHRRGVSRIPETDVFDPAVHKAVRAVEDETVQELKIIQVVREGYTFSGRVLRPMEVVVARPVRGGETSEGAR